MGKLTERQSAILSAHTGVLCGPFSAMHEYIEQIMGRPVWTHEMADQSIQDEIKEKSLDDFLSILPESVQA